MAIIKEKSGTYMVDVSLGSNNGKRIRIRRKGIKKLKDAQDIEAKIRNNKEIETKKINITFKDIYLKYINSCKIEIEKGNMRKASLESKTSVFEQHILPFFSKYLISNITKNDILEFQEVLVSKKCVRDSKKNLSNATLRKIHKQLSAFFEYCLKEEEYNIFYNPCKKVNNFKKEKKEKEYLTIDEFYSLTSNVDNIRDNIIIYLLFFSGIRISELLGLSLDSINLTSDTPYIKISETCHKGEIREYAKTDDSQDIVYIDNNMKKMLLEYINSDEFKKYNSKYLFPSIESKCGVLSEKAVGNMIKKYCIKSNINKHITPHNFRHSHAAMLIDMGQTLEDIKDRLRHASIKTTSDEYGHMYNSRKKELVMNMTSYINDHKI